MPSSRKNRGSRHRSHKQHQKHKVDDAAGYEVDVDSGLGPQLDNDFPEWVVEPLPAWVEGPSALKQDTGIAGLASRGSKRKNHQQGEKESGTATGFQAFSKRKRGVVSVFDTEGGSSTPSSLDRWNGGDSRADEALSLLTSLDSGRGESHGLDLKSFKADLDNLDAVGSSVSGHSEKEFKGDAEGRNRKGKSRTNASTESRPITVVDMPELAPVDANLGDTNIRIKNKVSRRKELPELADQEAVKFNPEVEPNLMSTSKGQPSESNASDSGKANTRRGGSTRRCGKDVLQKDFRVEAQHSHSSDGHKMLESERKKGKSGDGDMDTSPKHRKPEESQKSRKSEIQKSRKSGSKSATGDDAEAVDEHMVLFGKLETSVTGLEWALPSDNRNPELEKELENRIRRRREESGDRDRWRDDEKDRDSKRHHHQSDNQKGDRYKENSRQKDDMFKGERHLEEMTRDDKVNDDKDRSTSKSRDANDREVRSKVDKHNRDKQKDARQKVDKGYDDRHMDDKEGDEKHRVDKDRDDRHTDGRQNDRHKESRIKNDKDRDKQREYKDGRLRDDKSRDSRHRIEKEREDKQREVKNHDERLKDEKHKDGVVKSETVDTEHDGGEKDLGERLLDERERIGRQKENDDKLKGKDKDEKHSDEMSRDEKGRADKHIKDDGLRDDKRKDERNKNVNDQVSSIKVDKMQGERQKFDKHLDDKENDSRDKYGGRRDKKDEAGKQKEEKGKDGKLRDCKDKDGTEKDGEVMHNLKDESTMFERLRDDDDTYNRRIVKVDPNQDDVSRDERKRSNKEVLNKRKDVKDRDDMHLDGMNRGDRHMAGMTRGDRHNDDKCSDVKQINEKQEEQMPKDVKLKHGEEQLRSDHSAEKHEARDSKEDKKQINGMNMDEKQRVLGSNNTAGCDESFVQSKEYKEQVRTAHNWEQEVFEKSVREPTWKGTKDPMVDAHEQERAFAMPASSCVIDAAGGYMIKRLQEMGSGDSAREKTRLKGHQTEPEIGDFPRELGHSKDEREATRSMESLHDHSVERDDFQIKNKVGQQLDAYAAESQTRSIHSPQNEVRASPQKFSPRRNGRPLLDTAQRSPSPSLLDGTHLSSYEKPARRNKFETSISVGSSSATWRQRERSRHLVDHIDQGKWHYAGEEEVKSWEPSVLHRDPDNSKRRSSSPDRNHDSLPLPGPATLGQAESSRGSSRSQLVYEESGVEREHRRSFSQGGGHSKVRRLDDTYRERTEWMQHGLQTNRSLGSSMVRPQLAAFANRPSGPPGLLPPPPPLRPGIDNPAILSTPNNVYEEGQGPRESGRYDIKVVGHYKRPEMGGIIGPGDTWRGVGIGNWNAQNQGPGPSNRFSPFPPQVVVHPSGFTGMGQQFPLPPLFGRSSGPRPSTEMVFGGGRFHVGDGGGGFHGPGPVMSWRRPGDLDDTRRPPPQGHLDTWEGQMPYADDRQRYGRLEWEQSALVVSGRRWERGPEVWQGHGIEANTVFNTPNIQREASCQGSFGGGGALIASQERQPNKKLPQERASQELSEELRETPPTSAGDDVVVTVPSNDIQPSKRAFAKKMTLLLNLNISAELAGTDLYKQYLNLLPISETKFREHSVAQENSDHSLEDDCDLELDLEAEALLSETSRPCSQFLSPIHCTIFQATTILNQKSMRRKYLPTSVLDFFSPPSDDCLIEMALVDPDIEMESFKSMKTQMENTADQLGSPKPVDFMDAVSSRNIEFKGVYFATETASRLVTLLVNEREPVQDEHTDLSVHTIKHNNEDLIGTDLADNSMEDSGLYCSMNRGQEIMHQDAEMLAHSTDLHSEEALVEANKIIETLLERSLQICEARVGGSIVQGINLHDFQDFIETGSTETLVENSDKICCYVHQEQEISHQPEELLVQFTSDSEGAFVEATVAMEENTLQNGEALVVGAISPHKNLHCSSNAVKSVCCSMGQDEQNIYQDKEIFEHADEAPVEVNIAMEDLLEASQQDSNTQVVGAMAQGTNLLVNSSPSRDTAVESDEAIITGPVLEGLGINDFCTVRDAENAIDWATSLDEKLIGHRFDSVDFDSPQFEERDECGVAETEMLDEWTLAKVLEDDKIGRAGVVLEVAGEEFRRERIRGKFKPQQSPQKAHESTH